MRKLRSRIERATAEERMRRGTTLRKRFGGGSERRSARPGRRASVGFGRTRSTRPKPSSRPPSRTRRYGKLVEDMDRRGA